MRLGGSVSVKVRLHGTRQAGRLARDLLCGNSVYMVSSCRARLLHIIHVSTFFWGRCSSKKTEATARDSMCRAAIISSDVNCCPGSQQSRVCCVQGVTCKRSCCILMFLYLRHGCPAAVTLPVASRVITALGVGVKWIVWLIKDTSCALLIYLGQLKSPRWL